MADFVYESAVNLNKTATTTGNRQIVSFAVLDYDSLTGVKIGDEFLKVCAVLYKKITIVHNQQKVFTAATEDDNPNNAIHFFAMLSTLTYKPDSPASDNFTFSGTRTIGWKFALIIGSQKYEIDLGMEDLVFSLSGTYDVSGEYSDLTSDRGSITTTGPTHTHVSGKRIFGASVYVGNDYTVFSFDEEDFVSTKGVGSDYDSPMNFEDWTQNGNQRLWEKSACIVGVIPHETRTLIKKSFPINSDMDGRVYAVGYGFV